MTQQGRKPTYSDEPLAQWIKQHVEKRGWKHQDLEAKLARASGGRLGKSGAKRLVHGATRHTRPNQANLDLLAKVLGEPPPTDESALAQMHGRLLALEERVAQLVTRDELVEAMESLRLALAGSGAIPGTRETRPPKAARSRRAAG